VRTDMQATPDPRAEWQDALLAARLLSIAGNELGGIHLRAGSGPVRDAWLECFAALTGADKLISIPVSSSMDRLCGGMDVHATLTTGKIEIQTGLLAKADGGFAMIPGAERLDASALGAIIHALELKTIEAAIGTAKPVHHSRFGLIAIDEAAPGETGLAPALTERLALNINLDGISWSAINTRSMAVSPEAPRDIHSVKISDTWIEVVMKALSTPSPRRLILTLNVAKSIAALERRAEVSLRDILTAVRLSGHSTEQLEQQHEEEQQQPAPQDQNQNEPPLSNNSEKLPDDMMIDAALADIRGIELAINAVRSNSRLSGSKGTSGERRNKARRGRVLGLRDRPPFPDARPDITATLRAAAPWQAIRRAERAAKDQSKLDRVILQASDFRYRHYQDRRESAIIFAVDASGSTAMDRLGEAKGAVELLLADCYAQRHHVALVAFRGVAAETLLAPTRSLVRAKRGLQALPGGGTTPLASGLKRATELALTAKSKGQTPLLVIISDGSGNIDLDGNPGRAKAHDDTLKIARLIAGHKINSMVIDIGRRGAAKGQPLAKAMGGQYKPLPYASAKAMSSFIQPHLAASKK
jgi:magnesium chelatase subunit D